MKLSVLTCYGLKKVVKSHYFVVWFSLYPKLLLKPSLFKFGHTRIFDPEYVHKQFLFLLSLTDINILFLNFFFTKQFTVSKVGNYYQNKVLL